MRTIYSVGRLENLDKYYEELEWHKIKELLSYHDLIQLRSIKINGEPGYLAKSLVIGRLRLEANDIVTRQANRRLITRCEENQSVNPLLQKSFLTRACDLYNEYMTDATLPETNEGWVTRKFKEHIKAKLLERSQFRSTIRRGARIA